MGDESAARFRSGLIFGLVAYVWWGLVPLYFAALKRPRRSGVGNPRAPHRLVAADHARAHRPRSAAGTICSACSAIAKLVLTLLLSSTLLAVNWLLYIYATVTEPRHRGEPRLLHDAARERGLRDGLPERTLRPAHYPALALVAIGVAIPFVAAGYVHLDRGRAADHVRLLRTGAEDGAGREHDRA